MGGQGGTKGGWATEEEEEEEEPLIDGTPFLWTFELIDRNRGGKPHCTHRGRHTDGVIPTVC